MSLTKSVAGTAVGVGALALVGRSAKMVKDICPGSKIRSKGQGRGLGYGKGKGPMDNSKKLVKGMVDLTIGTALLVPSAKLVGELD